MGCDEREHRSKVRSARTLRNHARGLVLAFGLGLSPLVLAAPAWAAATPESFADLIDQVTPAVVQITTTQKAARLPQGANPLDQLPEQFREGPLRDFFERFFREGAPGLGVPAPMPRNALGSGFIIDASGIVVTNNHVIGDASDIKVNLKDGRELSATLVGSDEKTDLAVLRIKPDKPLPAVTWGDSDTARVGDWVIAIGNPFGLGGTVTAGIISSRGRDIGAGPYDDFIQIDAPINSGNSGGPLFNSDGKVIGVNTAILSPSGGSIGIGFAIPSDLARKVVAELQEKGSVDRGWLGVAIQPVTEEVADSLGLKEAKGALVASVTADSPAAKAGVRQGDVITGFDGRPVSVVRDLTRAVADAPIGDRKTLEVWRGEKKVSLNVQIGEMPKQLAQTEKRGESGASPGEGTAVDSLGVTVLPLDDAARARFGVEETSTGVVVATVAGDQDAATKGIRPGDIIVRANDKTIETVADLQSVVKQAKNSGRKAVLLLMKREGETRFIAVQLTGT